LNKKKLKLVKTKIQLDNSTKKNRWLSL